LCSGFYAFGVSAPCAQSQFFPKRKEKPCIKYSSTLLSFLQKARTVRNAKRHSAAYLLGRRLRGSIGSLVAILGTILPSFFVILFIAVFLLPFFDYPKVEAFFRGCAVAIVGQFAFAGLIFCRKLLRRWVHFAVCAVGLIVVSVLGAHPIWGLITAGVLGFWLCSGDCNADAD